MIVGWVSIMASYVIIYIKAKEFSTGTHALIGYSAGILATLQILNSFFRPAPDSRYRWIFNYGHWALGMAGHILACKFCFQYFIIEFIIYTIFLCFKQ